MARPLRIEFPGALYHVTSRGNGGQTVFLDDTDRESLIAALAEVIERMRWLCHGYCLMGNHYHLLIETPEPNLSHGMRQLGTLSAQRFNRRHGRQGHVFQGRFKAILVERDSHWLELCRYVVLNPVRAGMIRRPEAHIWSSYRATAGLSERPAWLWTDWVLAQFGKRRQDATKRYREFVCEGIGKTSPWSELRGQVVLGTDGFVQSLGRSFAEKADLSEVPRQQRLAHRPTLATLFAKVGSQRSRDETIRDAHVKHGYALIDIGRHLGLHYTTISKASRRAKKR
jgi:putative transposase